MLGELERHAASSGLHVEGSGSPGPCSEDPGGLPAIVLQLLLTRSSVFPSLSPKTPWRRSSVLASAGPGPCWKVRARGQRAVQRGSGLCGSVSRVVSLPSGRGLGSNAAGVAFAVPAWWVCGSTAGAQGGSGVPGPPMWTCASLGLPHSARRRLCAVLGASAGEAACTVGGRGARKVATGPWRVPTGWRALLGRGNLSSAGSESEPGRCGCLEVAVAGPPRRRSCKPAEDSGWALG